MPPEPLHYAAPVESPSARHNRIYTILLIVYSALCGMGIMSMTFMSRNPRIPADSKWVYHLSICINAFLIAGMVTTLVLRNVTPGAGRIATKALNIVLLIAVTFGTVIGIYGLWKVDKDRSPTDASS